MRPRFAARPWVAAGALGAMVLGAFFASKHGGAYSASAADMVRHMEVFVKQAQAFHRSYWQAEGAFQQGELKLRDEEWYDNGSLRMTSTPSRGGDRLFRKEGDHLERYERAVDGSMLKGTEESEQSADTRLNWFLGAADIKGREAEAKDLGTVELDGRRCEQISIPTYDSQRTLVWFLLGSEIPVRFERDNRSNGDWHATWVFTVEYADHWPASTFDPETLGHPLPAVSDETEPVIRPDQKSATRFAGPDGVVRDWTSDNRSNSKPTPGLPAWRTGNYLFVGFEDRNDKQVAETCRDEKVAKAILAKLGDLRTRYGMLQQFGSEGPGKDIGLSHRETDQPFDLWFGKHEVKADFHFTRDSSGMWKATEMTITEPNRP